MRTRSLVPVLAVAIAGCQAAAPLSDADVAAIGDIRDAYAQAMMGGDAAGIAALFAEDATLMEPNMPAVVGRAAIQGHYEAQGAVTEMIITSTATEGQGTLAVDRGTYSVTVAIEGMPEPYTDTGKYVTVCERQTDGSWLITADIYNSDLPLPEPPAPVDTT